MLFQGAVPSQEYPSPSAATIHTSPIVFPVAGKSPTVSFVPNNTTEVPDSPSAPGCPNNLVQV